MCTHRFLAVQHDLLTTDAWCNRMYAIPAVVNLPRLHTGYTYCMHIKTFTLRYIYIYIYIHIYRFWITVIWAQTRVCTYDYELLHVKNMVDYNSIRHLKQMLHSTWSSWEPAKTHESSGGHSACIAWHILTVPTAFPLQYTGEPSCALLLMNVTAVQYAGHSSERCSIGWVVMRLA